MCVRERNSVCVRENESWRVRESESESERVCESDRVRKRERESERPRDWRTLQSLALEYCGSLRRFMHVDAVGSRASAARLWGTHQDFHRL